MEGNIGEFEASGQLLGSALKTFGLHPFVLTPVADDILRFRHQLTNYGKCKEWALGQVSSRDGGDAKGRMETHLLDGEPGKQEEKHEDEHGSQCPAPAEGEEPTQEYLLQLGRGASKGLGKGGKKGEIRSSRFEVECNHCGKWGRKYADGFKKDLPTEVARAKAGVVLYQVGRP